MATSMFEDVKAANVNGTSLAYCEQGGGEAVVFVHGHISDLRTWEQQLPSVGRSYRAITYSRRFARPNQDIDPGAPYPMLPHVEDLVALLRELGAVPAHLVGNSWGAAISVHAAVRYPEVVRTLVLEEPALPQLLGLSLPPSPAELLRLLANRPRVAITTISRLARYFPPLMKALRRGRDDEAVRIFAQAAIGRKPYERLPEARKQQMRDNGSILRPDMLRPTAQPPLDDDDIRRIRVPALLVSGELSPTAAIHTTDRLEELLPIVERIEIPDASHIMHEENPGAVNEAIIAFFRRARQESTHTPVA